MAISDIDLGPLPQTHLADDLQADSLKAFAVLCPTDLFLVRDQRADDKGVDLAIELKIDGRFTNLQSKIQLKATRSPRHLKNGVVSLSVDVSNINYLANGPSPIYVLWLHPAEEFRYLWVHDEIRRLEKQSPSWRARKTVALHFVRLLDSAAFFEIHTRILKEGRLTRAIAESIARAAPHADIKLKIDQGTLKAIDGCAALEFLLSSGLRLVNEGNAATVLEWAAMIPQLSVNQPRVQLTIGFAHYFGGRYRTALDHLGIASLNASSLSNIDGHFLKCLLVACEFRTGKIDREEYFAREIELSNQAPANVRFQNMLAVLQRKIFLARAREERYKLADEIRQIVNEAVANSELTVASQLQAKLVLCRAEFVCSLFDFRDLLAAAAMRRGMGLVPGTPRLAENLKDNQQFLVGHEENLNRVLRQAIESELPGVIAEAILQKIETGTAVILLRRLLLRGLAIPSPKLPDRWVASIRSELERVRGIFRTMGSMDGELRTLVAEADFLAVNGDREGAAAAANRAIGPAMAMEYSDLANEAQEILNGESGFLRVHSPPPSNTTSDDQWASLTDVDANSMATDYLAAMELPPERLENIVRDLISGRDIARERLDWCRHLQIHQHLQHLQSPSTAYAKDCMRSCFCELLGSRSRIELTDWRTLIDAFKRNYCSECAHRSPNEPN